jgi:hypothetical protein
MIYNLGKFVFVSKRAAIEHIKEILSGIPLRWPFKRIVSEFVEAYGTPAIRKRATGAFGMEFVNEADAIRFREFHDARAVLSPVSRDAHSRLRHAQLTALAAEDSDNGECASSDLFKEFPRYSL